jgi:iron complex outermembrane receptor protein
MTAPRPLGALHQDTWTQLFDISYIPCLLTMPNNCEIVLLGLARTRRRAATKAAPRIELVLWGSPGMSIKRAGKAAITRAGFVFLGLAAYAAHMPARADQALTQSAQSISNDGGELNEIIVTANKREESINKVGLTIQAIGGADLQQRKLESLQDLAAAVPGLTYAQTEQSTPVYTLRGVGFYDTSLASYPDVSVYVDQEPLPFPVLTTLTIFDLERVEVLKGPQGILFGNNATGGAINYVAAKPTKDFAAGGDLSYGRFSTVQADGFVSGPIASDLRARVAFNYAKGSGYQFSAT